MAIAVACNVVMATLLIAATRTLPTAAVRSHGEPTTSSTTAIAATSSAVAHTEVDRQAEGERKLLTYWSRFGPGVAGGDAGEAMTPEARRLLGEARTVFERRSPLYTSRMYAVYCTRLLDGEAAMQASLRANDVPAYLYDWWFRNPQQLPLILRATWLYRCREQMEDLSRLLEQYANAHGGQYPASLAAVQGRDLPCLPRCPAEEGCGSYAAGYRVGSASRSFALVCERHVDLQPAGLEVSSRWGTVNLSFVIRSQYAGYQLISQGLYNPNRVAWAPPLLAQMHLRPAQKVADVGCGVGTFTIPMARQVGPEGRVYAVDIDLGALKVVGGMAAGLGLNNVRTVQSSPTRFGLPTALLDAALLNDVYHCLIVISRPDDEKRYRSIILPLLRDLRRSIKPGGRLLISDAESTWGRSSEARAPSVALVRAQVEEAGFEFASSTFYECTGSRGPWVVAPPPRASASAMRGDEDRERYIVVFRRP